MLDQENQETDEIDFVLFSPDLYILDLLKVKTQEKEITQHK